MEALGSCLVLWLASWLMVPAAAPATAPAAVDAEMVRWAEARVPAGLPHERRLMLLHRALVDHSGLALGGAERTATARQAFVEGGPTASPSPTSTSGSPGGWASGLFRARPRHRREGQQRDLRVLEGHMAVGFGGARGLVVDAAGVRRAGFRRFERIGDGAAAAIFLSNRGVEALLDGAGRRAVAWLEEATRQAPELAPLWRNLGVARRRAGDLPGAAIAVAQANRLARR